MLAMKLAIVEIIVAKVAMGMADLVTNPNSTMQIGWIIALPPTPAMVQSALKKITAKMPPISVGSTGKVSLCWHFLFTQTSDQLSLVHWDVTLQLLEAVSWHMNVRAKRASSTRERLR